MFSLGVLVSTLSFADQTSKSLDEKGQQIGADIQSIVPKADLPGVKIPYYMRDDEGERYLVGGIVVNFRARMKDTGEMFELATLTGGMNAEFPVHARSNTQIAYYVMDGSAELVLNDKTFLMSKGDYANVPESTIQGWKFKSHRTKIMAFYSGESSVPLMKSLGQETKDYVQPEHAQLKIARERLTEAETVSDIKFIKSHKAKRAVAVTNSKIPNGKLPYVLLSGEGERYVAADQLYTFLGDQVNSGNRFITVMTEGPQTVMIPRHYHRQHSENFYCLDGSVDMIVNNSNLTLQPGDFATAPAGTIHAYKLNNHYTRFIGFLPPGLFSNFFKTVGGKYKGHVYPAEAYPSQFGRVLQKLHQLDLVVVDTDPASPIK